MFIIKRILLVLNILVALILLATYIPTHIYVDRFAFLTLLGYLYPVFLIINVLFIVLWLIIGPRLRILWSLAVILLHVNFIPRLVNISPQDKEQDDQITILTYNVEGFHHNENAADSIVSLIARSKADIVVLQDYVSLTKDVTGVHYRLTNVLKYRYYYSIYKGRHNILSDCVIYSKYLLRNTSQLLENSSSSMMYVDIATPQGDIRVYDLHLVSYQLDKENKDAYKKITKGDIGDGSESKAIMKKLVVADTARKYQVDKILENIEQSKVPYLLVGDFNSTPFSYVYQQFSKKTTDSFVAKGFGIGTSYNGEFPGFRIDYILGEQGKFDYHSYERIKVDFSDHYPIIVRLSLKDKNK